MVGGVANAAVTGVGAAATASTLTSTAIGLKSLTTALSKAEENVALIIGKLLHKIRFWLHFETTKGFPFWETSVKANQTSGF